MNEPGGIPRHSTPLGAAAAGSHFDMIKLLLRAGINDWGGISPVSRDYINPEAAWPHIGALAKTCRDEGFTLCQRLAIYDEYIERPGFLAAGLRPVVSKLREAIAENPEEPL